jgi:hypothetical protein
MVKIASPTVNAGATTIKEINFSRLQNFFQVEPACEYTLQTEYSRRFLRDSLAT